MSRLELEKGFSGFERLPQNQTNKGRVKKIKNNMENSIIGGGSGLLMEFSIIF